MKKLVAMTSILFLVAGLAACQLTPTPAPLPMPTATITLTPLPPTPTVTPTSTPIPPLNSPNGPPLRAISMLTLKDGWGLIENALLVTHDGGATWASIPLSAAEVTPGTAFDFVNLNEVHLVIPAADGKTGWLYYTSDGGQTWEINPVPFARGQLDRYGFFMERVSTGADGMEIALYRTMNWIGWTKIFPATTGEAGTTIPKEGIKTGFSFLNSERGWIGLKDQINQVGLYQTTNSGQNWFQQDVPLPQNIGTLTTSAQPPFFFLENATDGFLPVDFTAQETGASTRFFYITQDGGETWTPGGSVPEGGVYTFLDPQTGWAWGKRGVYATTDGAKTWLLLPVAFNRAEEATGINFLDAKNGWLVTVGQKSRVHLYRTTDGGYSWTATIP